ncbi:PepSY domain-containing protein [soil metagenome]
MSVHPPGTRWYNAVWRWHFYAGLFCIPFVIWLALTGAIYLWRPQLEGWLDQRYDQLVPSGATASPDAQVAAALAAVPGGALRKYVLPQNPHAAVRILIARHGQDSRVYLDPYRLRVLAVVREDRRLFPLLSRLHGELLIGTVGSYIVEIAACWAIVMLLTGIYLWWPRGRRGWAGAVYPRLRGGRRVLWRDLHATAGLWVSLLALGLILTGLPWAKGWGSYLGEIRTLTSTTRGPVDWTIGGKAPRVVPDDHAGHRGMAMTTARVPPGDLARVIATARPFTIAPPVLIAPPVVAGGPWSVTSDAANRPLRAELKVDGATGRLISRTGFAQRHWIDRVIGYGIAAHEGALLGISNQIVGTLTALFLILLAVSGAVMWWRRRPIGLLGAPVPLSRPRFGPALVAAIVALAVYMPMFGLTLFAILSLERTVLRELPAARRWLGLSVRGTG